MIKLLSIIVLLLLWRGFTIISVCTIPWKMVKENTFVILQIILAENVHVPTYGDISLKHANLPTEAATEFHALYLWLYVF